jgi:hypothetical protein
MIVYYRKFFALPRFIAIRLKMSVGLGWMRSEPPENKRYICRVSRELVSP